MSDANHVYLRWANFVLLAFAESQLDSKAFLFPTETARLG